MPEYSVVNGWLMEHVDYHTCGTGPNGYYGLHEPGCGTEPIAPVEQLLRPAPDHTALLRECRDLIDEMAFAPADVDVLRRRVDAALNETEK